MRKIVCSTTNEIVYSYRDYLNTNHWMKMRKFVFDRFGRVCQKCSSVKNIQVHHLTYARIGKEHVKDLIPLCDKCHSNEHEILSDKDWYFRRTKKIKTKTNLTPKQIEMQKIQKMKPKERKQYLYEKRMKEKNMSAQEKINKFIGE